MLIRQLIWNSFLLGKKATEDKFFSHYWADYCIRFIYSWNSLTRSRWDQRKYFELSEVRVKHQLSTILFMSIDVRFSTFRVMVHTSYDIDTLYNWFCAFLENIEAWNTKWIWNIIYWTYYSRNNKTYDYHSVSTHRIQWHIQISKLIKTKSRKSTNV